MCTCMCIGRAADVLNVRAELLVALAEHGHVDHHRHGDRITITKTGLDDLRWRLACAQAA